MKNCLLFLLFFISVSSSFTQPFGKPFVLNYKAKEYRAHVQNWSAIQDNRGIMYFGNSDGLIEYDGEQWKLIPMPTDDVVWALKKDEDGRIYIGSQYEIGYLSKGENHSLRFFSLKNNIPEQYRNFLNVNEIQCVNTAVFFKADHHLFILQNDSIRVLVFDNVLTKSFVVNNQFFVFIKEKGLFYYENQKLNPVPESDYFAKRSILLAFAYNKDSVLIGTNSGLVYYCPFTNEEKIHPLKSDAHKYYSKYTLSSFVQLYKDEFYMSTPGDGCIVMQKDGKIVRQINQSTGLLTNRIHNLYFDEQQNLWLMTNNGLSKVDVVSQVSYWDTKNNLDGNVESITRFNGELYIGTHQGLYVFDDNQIKKIPGFNSTCWSFFNPKTGGKIKQNEKLWFGSRDGIYELYKGKIRKIWNTDVNVYAIYQSNYYPDRVYVCTVNGLWIFKLTKNTLQLLGKVKSLNDNIRSLVEENEHTIWLGTFRNGAVKLQYSTSVLDAQINYFKTEQGLSSNKNVLIFPVEDRLVFGNDKGLNRYNPQLNRMEKECSFGKQFCSGEKDVFTFIPASDNKLWISGLNNKRSETGYLQKNDAGNYEWISKPFKKIPEMMVLAFYVEDDGIAWIGGSEGLFKFNYNWDLNASDDFCTQIRSVYLNSDSVLFDGNFWKEGEPAPTLKQTVNQIPHIDYSLNSLHFTFAAQSYIDESANQYSCFLDGYDAKWTDWQNLNIKEYTNLQEGDYVFKVKARDAFGSISKVCEYAFRIRPPWYRTLWAFVIFSISILLLLHLAFVLNTRRLKAANARLEEMVKQRTTELSEVNTQLEEQQAELEIKQEEITAQSELLYERNKELEKLSIVARETDNSVMIMDAETNFEWVNEGFNRIYKSSLSGIIETWGRNLIEASQNENIKQIVNECIEQKKTVRYQSKFTLINGQTLWIQTTLTPILDQQARVIKLIGIESDISRLKEAEIEIQNQRDELLILNKTKDKFFRIIAHDLRNPFNTILGFSEFIKDKIQEKDYKKALFFAELLHNTSSVAYELLENLLTWSRSQSGAIVLSPQNIEVKKILDYNVLLLNAAAQLKGIDLTSDVKTFFYVYADKNMLLTVLRNLITNAIKFSKEGDSIILNAEKREKDVLFSVQDTGIGMDSEIQKKLFRIDENIKSMGTANEPGTGLGLILCKDFIEKNHGKIWVESSPGNGSKFFFTLPEMNENEEVE